MSSYRSRYLASVLILLLASVCAWAKTRTVKGVVRNGTVPIPGAVVKIENLDTLRIRSYITQEDGTYHFSGLATNVDYMITAEDGGKKSTKILSKYDEGDQPTLDLQLK